MPLAFLTGDTSTSLINADILTDIGTLLTQIWTWITGNAYLTVFLTVSLLGVALGLFGTLKRKAGRG